jgi:N-formylglutamate deformylase
MASILHIPHASQSIPEKYLPYFLIDPVTLDLEILKMTDHFTDELFANSSCNAQTLKFPLSRLLVDPERFPDDSKEPMTAVGMGCLYTKTHNGRALKNVDEIRTELMSQFYYDHHHKFENLVLDGLQMEGKVLIIDCHSFPKFPLPYELDQRNDRAEFCLGTDTFHTHYEIRDFTKRFLENEGYGVAINRPFSGSIVPMEFYQKDKRVQSIMIEIRRDLYMDEIAGTKSSEFEDMKNLMGKLIYELDTKFSV